MKKRTATVLLWLYVGWYTGSMLADLLGADVLVGLIPGLAAAVIVVALRRRPSPFATHQ